MAGPVFDEVPDTASRHGQGEASAGLRFCSCSSGTKAPAFLGRRERSACGHRALSMLSTWEGDAARRKIPLSGGVCVAVLPPGA